MGLGRGRSKLRKGDGRQRQSYEQERFERPQERQQERYYENYREGEAGPYKRKEDYRGRYEEEAAGHHRREERYQRHDSEVVLRRTHLRDFMAFTTLEIYNIATVLSHLDRHSKRS